MLIKMLTDYSLYYLLLLCSSYALCAYVDSFVTTKGVELVSAENRKNVSTLIHCAMYCSMEHSCCKASLNGVSNECLMTSDCRMGLKGSEKGRMAQKRKSSVSKTCPSGWTNYGLSCYFFSTGTLNWEQAKNDCLSRGSYLAEVTTYDEMIFLKERITKLHAGFLIGATDKLEENVWVWESSKDLITVSDWSYNQPDDWNRADCCRIVYRKDMQGWDDVHCSYPLRYLCEQPAS